MTIRYCDLCGGKGGPQQEMILNCQISFNYHDSWESYEERSRYPSVQLEIDLCGECRRNLRLNFISIIKNKVLEKKE